MLTYLSRYHAELSGAGARQAESHAYRGASTEIRVALAIQSTARTIDRRKESQESSAGVAFGFQRTGREQRSVKNRLVCDSVIFDQPDTDALIASLLP